MCKASINFKKGRKKKKKKKAKYSESERAQKKVWVHLLKSLNNLSLTKMRKRKHLINERLLF